MAPASDVDPDPKLTVENFASVLVQDIDGVLVVTFGPAEFELNVGFENADGGDVNCGSNNDGLPQCDVFNTDGSFDSEIYELAGVELDANQVGFPAVINGADGTITVEVNGTAHVGELINFMDGPLFVQIDVNSGGLANEVTRIMGEATAAELAAALG